jgi:hypothetical protein
LMHQIGVDVQLVATEEDGTVEENAKIIACMIRAESRFHKKLILVSTSKGGPETALALGKILGPGETSFVKAWLSVGGLIRGTLLADRIMTWPKSWIARIIFSHEKVDFRSLPRADDGGESRKNEQHQITAPYLVVEYVRPPAVNRVSPEARSRRRCLQFKTTGQLANRSSATPAKGGWSDPAPEGRRVNQPVNPAQVRYAPIPRTRIA